jgi:hypothetical protein
MTLLIYGIRRFYSIKTLKYIRNKGVDFKSPTFNAMTPLQFAVHVKNYTTAQILIDYRSEPTGAFTETCIPNQSNSHFTKFVLGKLSKIPLTFPPNVLNIDAVVYRDQGTLYVAALRLGIVPQHNDGLGYYIEDT